ncbi:MAG: 30S ribosomal protein S18 [Aquificaceae bacterium]|nr:30S ribosomal protein S18 [Aquificaceae bacterium]MCS7195850.1 30S ribosomal protein S18 [Aquificaceae bacterium]MCX7989136.1 30S ribosomal protein S18 [Aquificaceae bacterium]MDW8032309.1 30S ribosomal protein S18 [Aquificaceae bacterium]MDW8294039.1 30S ribosomal protein S18 [Aquificaceae bacterium]
MEVVKRSAKKSCPFCDANKDPNYRNYEELKRFITERGKIIGRRQTGVCAKHQRMLSREIKKARQLALLPYLVA